MVGGTLMHFRQFFGADFSTDDSVLFCLDNGVANAVHDIIRTALCRKLGIESSPFTLGGMLQAAVYAVQFLFE